MLIKVKEYPRLERVIIEGNDAIDTDDIEQKITFLRGSILKPQEISKLKRKILTLYEEEGFLNATVDVGRYVYFTADTVDEDITVIWRNEKDFSDEIPVEYLSGDRTYSNLVSRIKDRVVLKLSIEDVKQANKSITIKNLHNFCREVLNILNTFTVLNLCTNFTKPPFSFLKFLY